MKFLRVILCLVLGGLIMACSQATVAPVQSENFDAVSTTTRAIYDLTLTSSVITSELPTATPNSVVPTPFQRPTFVPTIEPNRVDELLTTSFSIEKQNGSTRHWIRQITGWSYGFRLSWCDGYEWLDSEHLLLYPSVGQVRWGESGQPWDLTPRPVIIDLETGHVWLTYPNEDTWPGNCDSVYWSEKLDRLIVPVNSDPQDGVAVYTLEGDSIGFYSGNLLSVSPSRTKIAISDDTVIDLTNGKTTDFTWYIDEQSSMYSKIYWSFNETSIYRCCSYFGNTQNGEGYNFQTGELRGPMSSPSHIYHTHGEWVRNDEYFLVEWSVVDDGYPDYFPMFDPVAKKYYEVSEAAGIPVDWTCVDTSVSSDSIHVWIRCWEGNYLVDLTTFDSKAYRSKHVNDIDWSADGKYAWISLDDSLTEILSVANKELSQVLTVPSITQYPQWHPSDNILGYISSEKTALVLLDAQTMSSQAVILSTTFREISWSPMGDQIALLSEDGSLWKVDYPKFQNLEQLTEPMLNVRDVLWSPNGTHVSFIGGTDIYIVEANVRP